MKMNEEKRPRLIFVYNAGSDLFSTVTDFVHKIVSPSTYQCSLCALTYSNLEMKKEWKTFIERLDAETEFLYKDELKRKYNESDIELPAILYLDNNSIGQLIQADEINSCKNFEMLKSLVLNRLESIQ